MKIFTTSLGCLAAISILASCGQKNAGTPGGKESPRIKTEDVKYTADGNEMTGFVAYDENKKDKRPVVVIIHEWWGLNDYVKKRARDLAELGYLAFAMDMYGTGKKGENPEQAGALATPFYTDPQLAYSRIVTGMEQVKKMPQADSSKVAVIGYCFGGAMALNAARMGLPVKGIVSFHGGLTGVPPSHEKTKAAILVLHGAADPFVPEEEVKKFKYQMDSANVAYTFIAYEGATHAFTNPDATENGKKFGIPIAYNAAADSASWKEMQTFFTKVFK